MKKVTLLILVSILLLFAFTSCAKLKFFNKNKQDAPVADSETNNNEQESGKEEEKECAHEWEEATCMVAKTCKICAATEGSPLKHQTVAPTCTTPEMCKVCGFTSEYWRPALGHNWVEASCLTGRAKYCRTCGTTEGDIPEHQWSDPTCIDNAVCTVCNLVDKESALGHEYAPTAPVDPTCTEKGKTSGSACVRCGTYEEGKEPQDVPALEHKGYEVEVPGTPATCDATGLTPGKQCQLCGTITDPQLVLDAKGHVRYTYNEDGSIKEDGYIGTSYPINPDTMLPYAACESDGITVYRCFACQGEVEVVEPKVHHLYPDGATCSDIDAICQYCSKAIDHEYAEPTCYDPATCIICGDVLEGSTPLTHEMSEASCLAPATCALCGHTEGDKLVHELVFSAKGNNLTYTCKNCGTSFTPQDEVYYLDGSNHNYIVPVNNSFGGYDTHKDVEGNPTHFPKICIDENGNEYLSLIKVKDPETNDKGEAYPPQIQLWIPLQRGGFTGFSSLNAAVGFLSFRFNALMDKNFGITMVEGGGWTAEDALSNIFTITPPTANEETGLTTVQVLGMDDGNAETPALVIFEKDVTGASSVQDKFTGWHDVYIGIVLDDATDTINLHYYFDGSYVGSVTAPLTTAGNGIKCIYVSGNTNENGSGLMMDDIGFGYTAVGDWPFDVNHEHSYTTVADELEPTCTTDGYRVYACACGDIGNREIMPALGHDERRTEAVAATCTEGGHNAFSYCAREGCGVELIKKEVYPAAGHDYKTTVDRAATCLRPGALMQTCKTCGFVNQVVRPALGHEYALSDDCTLGGTCIRCDYVSATPIGHAFAPATCTEPATCMRDGCNVTEGEPLGHDYAAPTCTAAATCTRCALTDGYPVPHTISYKVIKGVFQYYCTDCGTVYKVNNSYYMNGVNHQNLTAPTGVTNAQNYTVVSGTDLPAIVDGHYQFINTTGASGQLQIWVPLNDNKSEFGFSSENRAVGVISFKMNAYVDGANTISFKLVDGITNSMTQYRWSSNAVLGEIIINALADGAMRLDYKHSDEGEAVEIYSFVAGEDNFTGWVDVQIGMEMNPDTDQVTYHFYINGEYTTSFSKTITTKTNSINCIYIGGYTSVKGAGLMLDDIAFGYTANGVWTFDSCRHDYTVEVVPATCTTDGYTKSSCNTCGHILITDTVPAFGHTELKAPDCTHGSLCATCNEYYGEALGHTGGNATCTQQAICEVCNEAYGSPAHDIVEATCNNGSYCTLCNEVFSDKVTHCPVATLENGVVTYMCKYCEVKYVLNKAYYQNIEQSLGNSTPVVEDSSYEFTTDDGNYKFTLNKNPSSNGKGWVWIPTNGTGVTDFEGFKNGTVGVLSFSLDVYTSQSFQVHLIDSDYRSGGPAGSFWEEYTMQKIFEVTPPDGSNVVTIKGWGGEELKTVQVSDANKYTGKFDVTVGIEMSGGKITFHYYLDGIYVKSVTDTFVIASGKVDGVTFLCETKVIGTGYTLDDVVFGYAAPYSENPAPVKPEE